MKRSQFRFIIGFFLGYTFSSILQTNLITPITKQPPPSTASDFFRFPTKCSPAVPPDDVLPTLLSKIHNNTSPYSQFPPPHIVPLLRPGAIHGWGSSNSVFRTLIEEVRPRVIVEVGTFLGASALHMAKVTRELGLNDTVIVCLDDFRGWPDFRDTDDGLFRPMGDVNGDVVLMQQFMQNVLEAGEERRVLSVPFATGAGLDALCRWGVQADLVEVDAGHSFHSAWEDINRAWKVLSPGGVLFGHDYRNGVDDYGVRRAVDLFAAVNGFHVKPDGKHWILYPRKSSPELASRRRRPLNERNAVASRRRLG